MSENGNGKISPEEVAQLLEEYVQRGGAELRLRLLEIRKQAIGEDNWAILEEFAQRNLVREFQTAESLEKKPWRQRR